MEDVEPSEPKPVRFLVSTRGVIRAFPEEVRRTVGLALRDAQTGGRHPRVKPLRGFGGAGVLEVVAAHDGNAYRAVYTVRFRDVVYVLHAFQKKSRSGAKTPRADVELIRARLQLAETDYEDWLRDRP